MDKYQVRLKWEGGSSVCGSFATKREAATRASEVRRDFPGRSYRVEIESL